MNQSQFSLMVQETDDRFPKKNIVIPEGKEKQFSTWFELML